MEKLLILGGTNFIGRKFLEEIVDENVYEITLFNRGNTNNNLFPNLTRIVGDRNTNDIQKIGEKNWDYILDFSCYYPASLREILKVIKPSLKRYVFISTCSVYDNSENKTAPTPEDGLLLSCTKEEEESALPNAYGNKKVACERLLQEAGIDYISLRPGLVYGKYDYTDRLYYWLYQVKTKNKVLVPDNGERLISITYVNDLVQACLKSLEIKKHNKTYNVMSQEFVSIAQIVNTAKKLLNKVPEIVNAPPAFLKKNEVTEWGGMPLWIDGDYFTYSNKKILKDFQLDLCDWEKSIAETITYYDGLGWQEPKYGLSEEKRLALLGQLQ